MIKKAILTFLLLSIFLFNIAALDSYHTKHVLFYGGPNKRVFGFSFNEIKTVSDTPNKIGPEITEKSTAVRGEPGTVVFNQDESGASTGVFYFYWKLYTPKATIIKITGAEKLTSSDGSSTIDWANKELIDGKTLSTAAFSPITIYDGGSISKPLAGSQKFELIVTNEAMNGATFGVEHIGSMTITVEGE